MPNYVQKLRATTTQNRHGFAESLKKRVSNKPVEYEDPRKGMSVEEVSRAYHTLKLIHTQKSEV